MGTNIERPADWDAPTTDYSNTQRSMCRQDPPEQLGVTAAQFNDVNACSRTYVPFMVDEYGVADHKTFISQHGKEGESRDAQLLKPQLQQPQPLRLPVVSSEVETPALQLPQQRQQQFDSVRDASNATLVSNMIKSAAYPKTVILHTSRDGVRGQRRPRAHQRTPDQCRLHVRLQRAHRFGR